MTSAIAASHILNFSVATTLPKSTSHGSRFVGATSIDDGSMYAMLGATSIVVGSFVPPHLVVGVGSSGGFVPKDLKCFSRDLALVLLLVRGFFVEAVLSSSVLLHLFSLGTLLGDLFLSLIMS